MRRQRRMPRYRRQRRMRRHGRTRRNGVHNVCSRSGRHRTGNGRQAHRAGHADRDEAGQHRRTALEQTRGHGVSAFLASGSRSSASPGAASASAQSVGAAAYGAEYGNARAHSNSSGAALKGTTNWLHRSSKDRIRCLIYAYSQAVVARDAFSCAKRHSREKK